jgi:hypothetical protein
MISGAADQLEKHALRNNSFASIALFSKLTKKKNESNINSVFHYPAQLLSETFFAPINITVEMRTETHVGLRVGLWVILRRAQ